jgi:predicted transcriptional regulator
LPFFVGVTETGKYWFFRLLFPFIPLFTRIKKDVSLENFERGRIYGYIENNPGTYYTEIMKNLGIGNGTLSHHLYILEKMNMIKSRQEGFRHRAFYMTNMEYPDRDKFRFTNLQSEIMKLVKENNGISEQEIVSKLGEKQQTINYNLKKLQRKNIIRLEQKGRETYCYANE